MSNSPNFCNSLRCSYEDPLSRLTEVNTSVALNRARQFVEAEVGDYILSDQFKFMLNLQKMVLCFSSGIGISLRFLEYFKARARVVIIRSTLAKVME
jgi:hypothetical protein